MPMAALLVLGAGVGVFASFFNVLLLKSDMTDVHCWTLLLGGLFGGGLAGIALHPAPDITPLGIAFMALAGYFSADIFAALLTGSKT